MVSRLFIIIPAVFISSSLLHAQNYQALHGSPYAGGLGAAVNPASLVAVPFAWDVTPVAIQEKHSTNAIRVNGFSLLSPAGKTGIDIITGKMKRYLLSNQDVRLLNTRIRINDRSAIAFGASLRSYQSVKTSSFNWQDSIADVRDFMAANLSNTPLETETRGMAWAEIFGSYARNLAENDNGIINAGITLTVNRGIGGAYVSASGLYFAPGQVHERPGYLLNNGQVEFAYSGNFDAWDNGGTQREKRKQFLQHTWSSLSFSIGAEYIIPSEIGEAHYAHDLRIGVSLADLGYNRFSYSANSRRAVLNKGNISDSLIQASFENLGAADEIPDSLAVIAGQISTLPGYFKVFHPARLILNTDKRITGNLFLNAELTLPLAPLLGDQKIFIRDMNFIALTPRYETRHLGIYLPATINSQMQFWLGGALRAGPLLLGIHNWSNLFSGNKMQNGGAYLALTFRPGSKKEGGTSTGGERRQYRNGEKKGRKGNPMGCPANVL